jgi:DNA invertase Pin-like site-specific DNA recombinase
MQVRGYIRVSTGEQADSRLGLEAQYHALRSTGERRGWTFLAIHEDAGLSGSTLERPALTEALSLIQPGQGLVVSRLDRLSRSIHDASGLMQRALNEGWSLISLDLETDMSTPQGRAMAQVNAVFTELERGLISQRTKEALAARKARGERVGGKPWITGELAERIRAMRETMTLDQICRALAAEEIPTPRGGRKWRPSSIQKVLARA